MVNFWKSSCSAFSLILAADLIFRPFSVPAAPPLSENGQKEQLAEAARYYEATLFDKAIPVLRNLLPSLHENTEQKAWARLKLAQCLYFTRRYSAVTDVLEGVSFETASQNPVIQKHNSEALFILGLSCNRSGRHEQAVRALLSYMALEGPRPLPFYYDAALELASAYYHQNHFYEAKQTLREITPHTSQKRLYTLSLVYLARIAIAEQQYPKAERIVDSLQQEAPINEAYPYLLAFLHGELFFSKGSWDTALHYFQQASPLKNINRAEWSEDALFYTGWCLLNLCEEGNLEQIKIKEHLCEAERTFKELVELFPSDRAYLGLGQCYLSQGTLLQDGEALNKLEELLSEQSRFSSRQAIHHALLLRAEASHSYEDRKKFFRQVTSDLNRESPYFANAWYLRGLNEFEEGQEHAIQGNSQQASKHLGHALRALNRAFDLLYPSDKKLAALSLKYQVQAYFHQGTREAFLKGLGLLGKLLNQYRDDLYLELEDPGEIYFLQGLIAANLVSGEESDTFFTIAENSLVHNLESHPKGVYYEESLNLLGHLYASVSDYEKAEGMFLRLAGKSPPSPFAAEAYFRASICAEMLSGGQDRAKKYRRKVYEQFNSSPFAAEAYFRYYDYAEYLKGNPQAIDHLEGFESRYPDSPFVLNALYLIGLDHLQDRKSLDRKWKKTRNVPAALQVFSRLEEKFHKLHDSGQIPHEQAGYFTSVRYHAIIERAAASLQLAENAAGSKRESYLQEAEISLFHMYSDFEDPAHSHAQNLSSGEPIAPLQEECAYLLARCYGMQKDDDAAERLLNKMIVKYQHAKITRGHYLSKVSAEMGRVKFRNKDYETAIEYFNRAEDAAKGKVLRADDLLEHWIERSFCHECKGEMDEAMLLLSQVINYDAVSPKRLKAMYLRAGIYEKQGRMELARRQLEAIAKKGGEWSAKAKVKLEKDYVYQ